MKACYLDIYNCERVIDAVRLVLESGGSVSM